MTRLYSAEVLNPDSDLRKHPKLNLLLSYRQSPHLSTPFPSQDVSDPSFRPAPFNVDYLEFVTRQWQGIHGTGRALA